MWFYSSTLKMEHQDAPLKHVILETIFLPSMISIRKFLVSVWMMLTRTKNSARSTASPYPILADVEKESAVDYGVLGKFMMMTITKRESFIIDPDGLIVKHYKNVDPDKHTDEVIEELKSLQKKA